MRNQIASIWWRVELGEVHYGIIISLVHVAAVCAGRWGYWSPGSRNLVFIIASPYHRPPPPPHLPPPLPPSSTLHQMTTTILPVIKRKVITCLFDERLSRFPAENAHCSNRFVYKRTHASCFMQRECFPVSCAHPVEPKSSSNSAKASLLTRYVWHPHCSSAFSLQRTVLANGPQNKFSTSHTSRFFQRRQHVLLFTSFVTWIRSRAGDNIVSIRAAINRETFDSNSCWWIGGARLTVFRCVLFYFAKYINVNLMMRGHLAFVSNERNWQILNVSAIWVNRVNRVN